MGLDISYYGQLELKTPITGEVDDDFYDEHHFVASQQLIAWIEGTWPGRTEGLQPGGYVCNGESGGFRAGSYSGYNRWRDQLDEFRGDDKDAFDELINFPDNEGYIGPVVSKKLAADFKAHAAVICARARTMLPGEGGYWVDKYLAWQEAFEVASDNGCVSFH